MREITAWRFMFGLALALAALIFGLLAGPVESFGEWVAVAAVCGILGLALAALATGLGLATYFASRRARGFIADLFDPSA